jgi:hypothetical protein
LNALGGLTIVSVTPVAFAVSVIGLFRRNSWIASLAGTLLSGVIIAIYVFIILMNS